MTRIQKLRSDPVSLKLGINNIHSYRVLQYALAISVIVAGFTACRSSNPFTHTLISKEISIDINDQEISFERAFVPKKQVSEVCFEYLDSLSASKIGEPPRFRDGQALDLTAFVIADDGSSYRLDHIVNSVDHYLCMSPNFDNWLDISKADKRFVKLIVRSNRQIHLSKIEWIAYDSGDI